MLNNTLLFSQIIFMKKVFSNKELQYLSYFIELTNIEPVCIIIRNNYLFFLVKNNEYFKAKCYLKLIRQQLKNNKALVIREEFTFLRTIFSFFPDTYIHDIKLEEDAMSKNMVITLFFIFDTDRAIAVGNNGLYINTVNFIFNNSVIYQLNNKYRVKIQCKKAYI